MPATIVQIAVFSQNYAAAPAGTYPYSATFGSPVAAGNTIVVAVAGYANGIAAGLGNGGMTDSNGNTYTTGCWADGGSTTSGGYCGMFFAPLANAGSTTVTFDAAVSQALGFQLSWDVMMIAVEYSGLGTASLQGGSAASVYGAAGNAPFDMTVTDSTGTSVTIEFTGPYGSGGPGTISGEAILDLKSNIPGILDLFVGISRTLSGPTGIGCAITSPSGYNVMALEQTEPRPDSGDYLHYWDGAHSVTVLAQPQIFVVT